MTTHQGGREVRENEGKRERRGSLSKESQERAEETSTLPQPSFSFSSPRPPLFLASSASSFSSFLLGLIPRNSHTPLPPLAVYQGRKKKRGLGARGRERERPQCSAWYVSHVTARPTGKKKRNKSQPNSPVVKRRPRFRCFRSSRRRGVRGRRGGSGNRGQRSRRRNAKRLHRGVGAAVLLSCLHVWSRANI